VTALDFPPKYNSWDRVGPAGTVSDAETVKQEANPKVDRRVVCGGRGGHTAADSAPDMRLNGGPDLVLSVGSRPGGSRVAKSGPGTTAECWKALLQDCCRPQPAIFSSSDQRQQQEQQQQQQQQQQWTSASLLCMTSVGVTPLTALYIALSYVVT